MLRIWITCFVLGSLIGKSSQLAWLRELSSADGAIITVLCLAMLLRAAGRLRAFVPALVGISGIVWGILNHAPDLPAGAHRMETIKRSPALERTGHAIVRSSNNTYGLVYQNNGRDRMMVRTWQSPSPFQTSLSWSQNSTPACSRHQLQIRYFLCHWRSRYLEQTQPHRLTRALIFGDKSALSKQEARAFRQTGAYHLLVVSGLHIGMFGIFLATTVNLLFRFFYFVRWIPPTLFPKTANANLAMASVMLLGLTTMTGLGVAAQRALIIFIISAFTAKSISRKFSVAAALQTLLFPLGWLSAATIMSWAAYLLVVAIDRQKFFRSTLITQVQLTSLAAACFGQLAMAGILLNPVVSVIFPFVLTAAAWNAFLPGYLAPALLEGFLAGLTSFSSFLKEYGVMQGLYWEISGWWQWIFFGFATGSCLNAWTKVSIRTQRFLGGCSDDKETMAGTNRPDR